MIETIFLVPHMHTDLGYTDLVANVMVRQLEILDEALEVCTRDPEHRWTIETACILRHWWAQRDSSKREALLELLRSGRWQLMALEMQLLTELSRPAELEANIKWAREFGTEHGIPVRGSMLNDIAGYARGLPTASARCGVDYLVGGMGGFRVMMPWAGLPPLFRWVAPDGASLLVWHLGLPSDVSPADWKGMPSQYGFGNSYVLWPVAQVTQGLENTDPEKVRFDVQVMDDAWRPMERQLEKRGYPYRNLMLQCSGDNVGIDPQATRWVREWNENIASPKLKLATADEFFDAIAAEIAVNPVPELSGDFHDPWTDLAPTYPNAFAAYRNNARRVEALRANELTEAGKAHFEEAQHKQLWFSEHTYALSAWEAQMPPMRQDALDAPELEKWRQSWADKEAYTRKAAEAIAATEESSMVPSTAYTGLTEPFSATVQAGDEWYWVDGISAGTPQRIAAGRGNLPLPGSKELGSNEPGSSGGDANWRFSFDANGALQALEAEGAGPVFDLAVGFADLTVYDVHGLLSIGIPSEMLQRVQMEPHRVQWQSAGEVRAGSLVTEAERQGVIELPEGNQPVRQQWRLLHGEGVLEIETIWSKRPRLQREAAYLSLPLKLHFPEVHIDQGSTIANVGHEELPGCFRDQYTLQDWVAISGGVRTLMVASREAGMVEVDKIRFHEYCTEPFAPETGSLHFLLSHNCWPTNGRLWQEGELRYTLRLKMLDLWQNEADLRRAGAQLGWPVCVSGEG